MHQNNKISANTVTYPLSSISLLEQITLLARQINCLDIERIANVCIEDIPNLVGVRLASLYLLDETSNVLRLQEYNHPFPINKTVSLNQNPSSPMVIAVRNKELIVAMDINKRAMLRKSGSSFSKNYKTNNSAIIPLICRQRVIGVLNLADKMEGDGFDCDDVALIELFSQLVGGAIGNIKLFEQIQCQTTTDSLGGLANHEMFSEPETELYL